MQDRLTASLASLFGSVTLLLVGVGIYGLMAYSVAQRRREIGVRVALGADRGRVIRETLEGALEVTAYGLAVGIVLALISVRIVASLLFEVSPHDPTTFAAASLGIVLVAAVTAMAPAWRAANIPPIICLKDG